MDVQAGAPEQFLFRNFLAEISCLRMEFLAIAISEKSDMVKWRSIEKERRCLLERKGNIRKNR
jgi:hypothetical protein